MDKIKIYLDTNMIHDYFINQAKAIKNKENAILPSKFSFMLSEKERLAFITSFLTKAEIARELISAHGVGPQPVIFAWDDLLSALSCEYISKFEFDESLVEIALKLNLKLRTLFNFMHLFIAMKLGCYIVSGDENFLRAVKNNLLYDKTLTYIELRKLMEEN